MKNIPYFVRYSAVVGLISGASLVLIATIFSLFRVNPFGQYELSYLNPVLLIFIFLGLRHFRFRHYSGYLEGWRAVSMGIVITFLTALVYAVGVGVILSVSETILELHKKDLAGLLNNLKEERSAVNTEELQRDITVFGLAFQVYLRTFALGIFFTFVSTIFVKKSKPEL